MFVARSEAFTLFHEISYNRRNALRRKYAHKVSDLIELDFDVQPSREIARLT